MHPYRPEVYLPRVLVSTSAIPPRRSVPSLTSFNYNDHTSNLILLVLTSVHTYPSIYPSMHTSIHPSSQSIHPSIQPSIHPYIHSYHPSIQRSIINSSSTIYSFITIR